MAAESQVRITFLGNAAGALGAGRQVEGMFSRIGHVARAVLAGLGFAGIITGLVKAGRAAVEFDRGMRNVNSIARLSEAQLQKLQKQVLHLAGPTAQAPKTLAAGLYDIVSSGFDAADAVKILAVTAKAATAGLTDTATATKAVVAVLNAYQLGAGDAREVSDVLFQTVNKGVLTFEELATSIGDVLPFAAQLAVPIEEIGAAMATMTLQGLSAAESSTRLKGVLVQLLKPGEELQSAIEGLGFASGEAMLKQEGLVGSVRLLDGAAKGNKQTIAAWMSDIRAIGGFLALSGGQLKVFAENARSMDDASKGAGATARAFAEQAKGLAFRWEQAKQKLTAAAIPIAQLLFPALVKGAGAVADFAGKVEQVLPKIKAGFAGFAGPIRGAIRTLMDLGRAGADAAESLAGLFGSGGAGGGAATTGRTISAAITSAVGAWVAYKGAVIAAKIATEGFNRALRVSPLGLLATIGTGALLFLEQLRGEVEQTASMFERAASAARNFESAVDEVGDARRGITDANLRLEAAELALERAIKSRNRVEKDAGRDSLEYREAQLAVKQAFAAREQAERSLTSAQEAREDAQRKLIAQEAQFVNQLATMIAVGQEGNGFFVEGTRQIDRQSSAYAVMIDNLRAAAEGIDQYGRRIGNFSPRMRVAAGAALYMVQVLGRLPTKRSIEVFLKDKGNREKIKRYLAELGLLPRRVTTIVQLRDAVSKKLAEVRAKLAEAKRDKAEPQVILKLEQAKDDLEELLEQIDKAGKKKAKPKLELLKNKFDEAWIKADEALKKIGKKKAEPKVKIDPYPALRALGIVTAALRDLDGKTATTYVKTVYQTVGRPVVRRASGGFVPGPDTGGRDSVHAMLAPGELVLNRSQQHALGGPARLARMFGFSTAGVPGDPVQHFATGGFVQGFTRRLKRSAARDRKNNGYKAKLKAVERLQHRLDSNRDRQDRLDRSIGQDERETSISVEEFITVDGDGNETLNTAAVQQRLAEIDRLVTRRNELIALIDEETGILTQLITALDAAVKAYQAEIRDQQRVIREMTGIIHDATAKMRTAPEEAQPGYQRIIDTAERRRDDARSKITELQGLVETARGDRGAFRRERLDQPLDRRDQELTIAEYQAERGEVQAVKPNPREPTSSDAADSTDAGGAAGESGPDLQAFIDELQRQLAQLRLALGIQEVQIPIIGAFARGSIHVPETGLALVHAGERITAAAVRGGDGGSIDDVRVVVNIADGMRWLERFIDVRVERGASGVASRLGREADRLARAGESGALSAPYRRL